MILSLKRKMIVRGPRWRGGVAQSVFDSPGRFAAREFVEGLLQRLAAVLIGHAAVYEIEEAKVDQQLPARVPIQLRAVLDLVQRRRLPDGLSELRTRDRIRQFAIDGSSLSMVDPRRRPSTECRRPCRL